MECRSRRRCHVNRATRNVKQAIPHWAICPTKRVPQMRKRTPGFEHADLRAVCRPETPMSPESYEWDHVIMSTLSVRQQLLRIRWKLRLKGHLCYAPTDAHASPYITRLGKSSHRTPIRVMICNPSKRQRIQFSSHESMWANSPFRLCKRFSTELVKT